MAIMPCTRAPHVHRHGSNALACGEEAPHHTDEIDVRFMCAAVPLPIGMGWPVPRSGRRALRCHLTLGPTPATLVRGLAEERWADPLLSRARHVFLPALVLDRPSVHHAAVLCS